MVIPEVQRYGIVTFEDDLGKQKEALGTKNKNYVHKFKEHVGQLMGPLYRGDFFAWIAPTGAGKSWWLMWSAKQFREQGLNVLFLSLEMQEQSVLRRFQQMYYRRTLFGEDVALAKFVKDEDGEKYRIVRNKIDAKQLRPDDIEELKRRAIGRFPHGRLKIVCRSGISIGELKAILSELKYQSRFVPDAIVLDYADKMTVSRRVHSERESYGIIWKELRDLALANNVAMVSASQTNRAAWGKHFAQEAIAEDYRKLTEVTGAVGIMADKRDRELGITMLRMLKIRDGCYESRDVYCSSNYHIGQPCMQSVWAKELELPENGGEYGEIGARRAARRGLSRSGRKI